MNPDARVDAVAHTTGVGLKVELGDVKAFGEARQQINEWCKETHTKAIAWCLYIFRDEPRMSVPEICEWLDEIGVRTPYSRGTWLELYRTHKGRTEKRVSDLRDFLRKKSVRFNS